MPREEVVDEDTGSNGSSQVVFRGRDINTPHCSILHTDRYSTLFGEGEKHH